MSNHPEQTSRNITKIIDEKYILKPNIVLADFGNYIPIDKNLITDYGDVQTRYYRSPEIILRLGFNEKSDIWAFGCTIYEILTGKILLTSQKSSGITSDMKHLFEMWKLFGEFPNIFYTSRKNEIFFRNDGTLKGFDFIPRIKNLFESLFCNDKNSQFLCSLIRYSLIYEPDKRPTARKLY